MVYYNFQGDELQNEFDEKMTHKYGDKYRCVKRVYPDVYKLPEDEIQPMTHIIRYQGNTMEEAEDLLRKHIKKNEPMWKEMCYIGDTQDDFSEQENDYNPNDLNSSDSAASSEKHQINNLNMQCQPLEVNRNAFIDDLYEDLKHPLEEGYFNFPYCDTEKKSTVGNGLLMTGRRWLDDKTMTSQDGSVSESNQPWTKAKKDKFWSQHQEFCQMEGIAKKNAENQAKEYLKIYGESLPYFQDSELANLSKDYIRKYVVPILEERLNNLNIDMYNDLTLDGRLVEGALMYNLGENKFKLNPDGNKPEDWSKHSQALMAKDPEWLAKECHVRNIGEKRNERHANRCLNAFAK